MAILTRSAVVLLLANVAVVAGCDARLASAEADAAPLAEAGTSECDARLAPPPLEVDAAAPVDAASEATGPKICNPQDPRVCEVATAAEGVPCPASYEDAKVAFACASLPTGSYWLVGGCGPYLIASVNSAGDRHDVQCLYDPATHALIGSNGYDDCGAFCGGVNHVHWGVDLSPCGITPGTGQGSCSADAGSE